MSDSKITYYVVKFYGHPNTNSYRFSEKLGLEYYNRKQGIFVASNYPPDILKNVCKVLFQGNEKEYLKYKMAEELLK